MLIEFRDHERGAVSRVPMIDITLENGSAIEAEIKGVWGKATAIFLDRIRDELGGVLGGRVTAGPESAIADDKEEAEEPV